MSGTTPPVAPTPSQPQPNRRGVVIVSAIALFIFFLAIVAAALLAYIKGDWGLVGQMAMIAATNATTVVGYWVGSSVGSDKKTDIMAANPPTKPTP
jgi:hypothetical protein